MRIRLVDVTRILVGFLVLTPCVANGTLIQRDLVPGSGDGLLTLDDETGLEWLDVTATLGLSFDDVSAKLVPGGDLEAFRYAHDDEVRVLWEHAGIPHIVASGEVDDTEDNYLPILHLQQLIGSVPYFVVQTATFGIWADPPAPWQTDYRNVPTLQLIEPSGGPNTGWAYFSGVILVSYSLPEIGSWLVHETGPSFVELVTNADTFIARGEKSTNEGSNFVLVVRGGFPSRALLSFDLSSIDPGDVTDATLVATIAGNGDNWGSGALRSIDALPLAVPFAEGNGRSVGFPRGKRTRGTGQGATWSCAVDRDISNHAADCGVTWNGGATGSTTAVAPIANGQQGLISWDVTTDVRGGISAWLLRVDRESRSGRLDLHSRESAAALGDPKFAPRLEVHLH